MKSKLPFRSLPNPSEQYTVLLPGGNVDFNKSNTFLSELHVKPGLTVSDKAVIELMYLYGLRISEVINIKASQISPTGHIFVQALKGGKTRIILSLKYQSFWNAARLGLLPLSKIYSRNYYYRLFKKHGYNQKFGDNNNFSVTHYFRHRLVQDLRKHGFSDRAIGAFLAHSSGKSIDHYG
jgi:site-specific recombinase XerD